MIAVLAREEADDLLNKVLALKKEAECEGNKVTHFVFTPNEWNTLRTSRKVTRGFLNMCPPSHDSIRLYRGGDLLTALDFPVEPYTTLLGARVVVAPLEYHKTSPY